MNTNGTFTVSQNSDSVTIDGNLTVGDGVTIDGVTIDGNLTVGDGVMLTVTGKGWRFDPKPMEAFREARGIKRIVLRLFWRVVRRWYRGHTWTEVLCGMCEHNPEPCRSCDDFDEWVLSKKDRMDVNRCYGPPMCKFVDNTWPVDEDALNEAVEHAWDLGCPYCTPDGHCTYGECHLSEFDFFCECGKLKYAKDRTQHEDGGIT